VARGQCYQRPYLGCREFTASFEPPHHEELPIDHTDDLGLLLFDIKHDGEHEGQPLFFQARLEQGVVHVPNWLHKEVLQS
jgi:CRISPR-associated protein Cas5d